MWFFCFLSPALFFGWNHFDSFFVCLTKFLSFFSFYFLTKYLFNLYACSSSVLFVNVYISSVVQPSAKATVRRAQTLWSGNRIKRFCRPVTLGCMTIYFHSLNVLILISCFFFFIETRRNYQLQNTYIWYLLSVSFLESKNKTIIVHSLSVWYTIL